MTIGKMSAELEGMCRFCFLTTRPLIQPCLCSGTSAFVHFKCLSKWICSSKSDQCSVCLHKFEGVLMQRVGKSIFAWIRHTNEASFIICFIYGFFFIMYIIYLAIFDYVISDGLIGDHYRLALLIPAIIFGLTFGGVIIVAIIHSYHSFREWQTINFDIKVTLSQNHINISV